MADSDWTTYIFSGAAWKRFGIMLLLMPILACVSFFIIFTAFFQFFSVLSKGETSHHLCRSGADLGRYAAAIIDFLTYHSDERPFPFGGQVANRPNRPAAAAAHESSDEDAAPPTMRPARKKPVTRKVLTRKQPAARKTTATRKKSPTHKSPPSKLGDKTETDVPSASPPINDTAD